MHWGSARSSCRCSRWYATRDKRCAVRSDKKGRRSEKGDQTREVGKKVNWAGAALTWEVTLVVVRSDVLDKLTNGMEAEHVRHSADPRFGHLKLN